MNRFSPKNTCIALTLILITIGLARSSAQGPPTQYYTASQRLHVAGVGSVTWSPDESMLAVTIWPNIQIWDAESWQLIVEIEEVYAGYISWHPDSAQIATVRGGVEENLLIWNAATGNLEIDLRRAPPPNAQGIITIYQLVWNPNGETIATQSGFDTFLIWDWDTDLAPTTPVSPVVYHGLVDIEWHPDGKRIATGGTDYTLRIWDSETGENLVTVPGYKNVEFNAAGTVLFGSGTDNGIHLWDSASGAEITSFGAGSGAVSFLELSPDDRLIAMRRGRDNIEIWDVTSEKRVQIFDLTLYAEYLDWNPSGEQIASVTDDNITIWELHHPES